MKKLIAVIALATSATFPLFAEEDENFVMTSEPVTFYFNNAEVSPYGVTVADAFAPVTYEAGDSVTVTAPDGTVTPQVTDAATDGTFSFVPTCGGVWTLTSSKWGPVVVAVPWSIYGESGTVGESTAASFVADMVQSGPDRKLKKSEAPPVAYSGDNWAGDLSKAATVTFTPPEGSGLEATTWDDLSGGNGARAFTFNAKGVWTVTLTFADNTTRTAHIDIKATGFMVFVK